MASSVPSSTELPSGDLAKPTGSSTTRKAGIVDLFAGIGCVARGFEATDRFESIALVDTDLEARSTWEFNHRHADYLPFDVADLRYRDLLESADGRAIIGIVGCPPCQGFSAAGRRRADDERNKLLGAFFDVIRASSPRFFVMENVPAILGRAELRAQEEALRDRYAICSGLMNAALYGLPQTRERAVVVGIDRELGVLPTLPIPTHLGRRAVYSYARGKLVTPSRANLAETLGASPQIGVPARERRDFGELLPDAPLRDLVSVWDAIGDLPVLDEERVTRPGRPTAFALSLRAQPGRVDNHARWGHTPDTRKRLATIPEGGRLDTKRTYYSQAYARLHRRGLARTVTTNFHNAGCGRFTHPLEPRTLSVREAARLQGIPDTFTFVGSGALQERLIGNAFPQPLAEAIARHLAALLDGVGALAS